MKSFLSLVVVAGLVGITGCATSGGETGAVAASASGKATAAPVEKTYITGSRIPDRPPRDRTLKRIEGEDYRKEDRTSIISTPTRQGN